MRTKTKKSRSSSRKSLKFEQLPPVYQKQVLEQLHVQLPEEAKPEAEPKHGRIQVSAKEKRTVDGILFASMWEAKVYVMLKAVIPAEHLHLQPDFLLQAKFRDCNNKGIRAIYYRADFLLGPAREDRDGPLNDDHIVVDAKGMKTDVFNLKCKMFKYHFRNARLFLPSKKADVLELIETYKELYD
jgi:hypothetical protein